jgi:N-acetylglucosaminyl-diphospho-decaprenol L-rhamnosyltransferase
VAVSGPPVTVAVVSYNTRERLLRCLASLADDVSDGRARVVVVDNASLDGSAAAARAAAPWARVVALADNIGFGAAVNLVAAQSDGEWLAVANADTEMRAGSLARLMAAGADPGVAALAPRLVLPGGGVQHSVGPLPTVALALAFAVGLPRLSRRFGDRLCLDGYWDSGRERDVPWAIAAFLLLRRSAFDAVGGFDDRQWMYAEDLDLGWRLRDAAYRTRYVPGATIGHVAAAATQAAFGDERRRRRRYMAATYRVIARRNGPARARVTAVVNALGAAGRLAWLVPLGLLDRSRRAQARDTADWLIVHLRGASAGYVHGDDDR